MGIRSRKTAIVGGAACVLFTLVAWEWVEGRADVEYRTATVGRGDIDVTVSATGNPNAVVTVQVGSQVSGNIQALFADFNTKVSKGQLIARIDPAPFQTKVNQAQATLDAARASVANSQAVVEQARANIQAATSSLAAAVANVTKAEALVEDARVKVDRRVVMLAENATAKEDLETAQTTYTSAVADRDALVAQKQAAEDNVKVARAQLNVANSLVAANQAQVQEYTAARQSAQIDLDHTSITAPVDGVVVSKRGRRPDSRGEPVCADVVPHRARPHQDAGGYQRVGGRCGPRSREPACDVHGRRVSGPDVHRHRHIDP